MRGINLGEECHLVPCFAPRDVDTLPTFEVWSMKGHSRANIILQLGVTGAATTVTVNACDNFTPSTQTAIPFAVYKCETANADVMGSRVEVAAAGFATSANDGIFYVIVVDAAALPEGSPNLQLVLSDPAAATFGSAIAVLTGARYAEEGSATAIS